jgi:2-polyprenyl-3-methyl-5-hydroxy-6-metoxy-1,4-benzoquinol methylase
MTQWHRYSPFSADHGREWDERWEYSPAEGNLPRTFDVRVRAGKPLDVLKLKGIDLGEVREYAAFLERTSSRLYGAGADLRRVPACPLCHAPLDGAAVELAVFGVPYVRCGRCGHVGVGARPQPEVLDAIFAESETHSSTYVDRNAIETRMTQIIAPKLDWCTELFRSRSRREPRSVVDVGAGGGHFLAGAARRGMTAEGFEKSWASRAFAHEAFGLDLREDDFLSASGPPADLITFWGLLEYVARPRDFIAAALRRLTFDGMLVVEVPRVDSLGTLVQGMEGAVVARHMDPTTHVNGFTDASLCTALVEEGFIPVAAWYFGMDAYEACVQAALRADDPKLFDVLADFIPVIQQALDRGRQCDDIIIAAVPARQP